MKGDACIYTSATRSLCVLEYAANVFHDEVPLDLAFTEYDVPDSVCHFVPLKELPPDWNNVPSPSSTKQFGSALLSRKELVCFVVPSTIVPKEMNFILNPAAAGFERIKILAVEPFTFDLRIKQ